MAEHDLFVDVTYEVPTSELHQMPDPTRHLYEAMRHKADELCSESGARLRTDRAPEVIVKQGKHVLGYDMTLVASRWAVVAPASVALATR